MVPGLHIQESLHCRFSKATTDGSEQRVFQAQKCGIGKLGTGNFSAIILGSQLTLLLDYTGLIKSRRIQTHFPGSHPDTANGPA